MALARALHDDQHGQPSVLVLDEPTASLPAPQVGQLYRTVRAVTARGIGVLYVSHHLQEIFDLADRVTVFRDGANVGTRSTSQLDHRALAQLIVGAEPDATTPKTAATGPGQRVLSVTGLSYNALRDLDVAACAGEIVGIAGITGSGRENVLPSIFGACPRDGGTVEVAGRQVAPADPRQAMRCGMAYLPSDRKINGGVMTLSARENFAITDVAEFWDFPSLRRRRERAAAQEWFDRLDVRPHRALERDLLTFSGGNQQKILLTKWLRRAPRVLLLEEPTQGVDIAAKALLHRQVTAAARAGACVVVSSADNEELAGLCDRVIVLSGGLPRVELSGAALTPTALTHAVLGLEKDTIA